MSTVLSNKEVALTLALIKSLKDCFASKHDEVTTSPCGCLDSLEAKLKRADTDEAPR